MIEPSADDIEAVGRSNLARIRNRRRAQLKRHGFATYADYLASPRWAMIRNLYFMHPDTPKACLCGEANEARMVMHHRTYVRIGSEDLTDLHPLCGNCHRDVHLAAERGLAPYDLEDYASAERKRRYAEERRSMLERRGDSPDPSDEPFSKHGWANGSDARRIGAQDRRELARALARTGRRF